MEAHRSYERFEEGHRVAAAGGGHEGPHYGRNAALAVAVMAAFLALATFLSNEAVKEVVTGETHRADTSARLESNRVKIDIAAGNAGVLQALGAGSVQARRASEEALQHETRIARELKPADAHLNTEIQADEEEADHAKHPAPRLRAGRGRPPGRDRAGVGLDHRP